jgi:uncharacterized membrane protein required for colicin V production
MIWHLLKIAGWIVGGFVALRVVVYALMLISILIDPDNAP